MGYKIGSRATKFIIAVCLLSATVAALSLGLGFGLGFDPRFSPVSTDDSSHDPIIPKAPFKSNYRKFDKAAVTTDTTICSGIGRNILRANGSSVDAAIATMLCVGLVNPHSCGIGGGHFSTIYERPRNGTTKILVTLLAREWAPTAATQDMFANQSSIKGGLAIGIPGEIKGFYEAWKLFGRLPWQDLIQPSIELCENGIKVESGLSKVILESSQFIYNNSNMRELFVKEGGNLIREGDLMKNKKLAATLRIIANDPFAFYNGSLADAIVEDIRASGGIITLEDLNKYSSSWKDPVNVTLQNGRFTAFNPPPPSGGVVLDFILNILDGYYFNSSSISDVGSTILTYQRIVETLKFAFAKRSHLGDPKFVDVTELVHNLTSEAYAESIRKLIDDNATHNVTYYGPTFQYVSDHGTAHMNILAPDGAAVAMTSTINTWFGSQVRGNKTGIIFNNQMDDFSTPNKANAFNIQPSSSNFIAPGKIPQSSMCPTIILDEQGIVRFMSGASGGARIATSTASVVINSLWFGMDLQKATDAARLHHQLLPNSLQCESWMDTNVVRGLAAKHHVLNTYEHYGTAGSVRNYCSENEGSQSRSECIHAVSDGRKGGSPNGF